MFRTKENGDFNQYWYSTHTINKILEVRFIHKHAAYPPSLLTAVTVQELEKQCKSVAFVSTPSVYFSLEEVCREAHDLSLIHI